MPKIYDYRTIVVGTDGSPLAVPTVARAAWLAAHDDADLVIVCAYSELSRRDEARNVATLGGDTRIGLVTGRADASAAVAAAVGVAQEQSAPSRRPCSSTASRRARSWPRPPRKRLISSSSGHCATPASPADAGTVATEVVRRAPCDVLIVRPRPDAAQQPAAEGPATG